MRRFRYRKALTLSAFALFAAAALAAVDRTVDTTADENDPTCAPGGCSLREAIAAAGTGDTVLFNLPGVAPWTITLTIDQLSIANDLTIVGPGAADLSISGNNARRVLVVQASADVSISGLTFKNGQAPSNADRNGGCLRVLGQATIGSSRFEGCHARTASFDSVTQGGNGGAVHVAAGGTFVGDLLVFATNSAGDGSFSSNFPPTPGNGGRGGAVANEGTATLVRSAFLANTAGAGGDPNGNGGEGGALANLTGGVLRVDDSTLAGNSSGDGATFMTLNGIDGRGGGAWCAGDCVFNNVTVSGNAVGTSSAGSANSGGGIAVAGGTTRLRNVTVGGNTANGTGGGIARSGGTLRTRNSVFSNNTGASSQHDCTTNAAASLVSEGWNWVRVNNGCDPSFSGTDLEGTSAAPLDPLLGALAANGGPTETRALSVGSGAIDGGDPSGCDAWDGTMDVPMTADQRSFPRPTDGDGDTLADCDIGAFEADAVAPLPHDLTVVLLGASGGGSVTSLPAGINCPGDCTESYAATESVELTATPASGYSFAGWSGACTGSTVCIVSMSVDRMVNATFVELFTLDVALAGSGSGAVTSAPPGIACPGTCSAEFADGAAVNLTATPDPGSVFVSWSGDCSGASCSLMVSEDLAVTAEFALGPDIFADGFESGDVCAWPAAVGAPPCIP